MELTENQKIVFSFAIEDIKKGYETLWVERLKKECPKLYEYAIKQRGIIKCNN